MGLKDEIKNYTDPNGLVQPMPNPGRDASGNGLLYTAEYLVLLSVSNQLGFGEGTNFYKAATACSDSLAKYGTFGGLFSRTPSGAFGQESIDDYLGLAALSYVGAPNIATNIIRYGQNNKISPFTSKWLSWIKLRYVYNNVNLGQWDVAAWFTRWPQLLGSLMWAADLKPGLLRRLYTALVIVISGSKGNADSWILSYLVSFCSQKCWMARLATKFWGWRLHRAYPGGMKDVFTASLGASHPVAKYWPVG